MRPDASQTLTGTSGGTDLDFQSIIEVFTHRHTKTLYPVQARALQKIIRASEGGLQYSHLEHIQTVFGFALEAVESEQKGSDVFIEPLCDLLRLHGEEFQTSRANEELDYAYVLSATFGLIGNCLQNMHESIVAAATQAISSFVNLHRSALTSETITSFPMQGDTSTLALEKCPARQLHYCIVAHSGVIKTLLEVQEEKSESPEICLDLTRTVKDVSFSPLCAQQVIDGGFFAAVPLLLNRDAREMQVDIVLELVWNLIESNEAACATFGTESNVRVLMVLLQQLLHEGHRAQDKELRNEILVILSLIARTEANRANLARTTCLRTVLLCSTCAELYNPEVHDQLAIQAFTQSTDVIDLELKLLMWTIAGQCVSDRFSHAQIVQAEFLRGLLMFLDPAEVADNPSITRWSYTQLLQLQQAALHILIRIAPLLPEQFTSLGAVGTLIVFADEVVRNPDNLVQKQLASQQTRELQALALQALLYATRTIDFTAMEHPPSTFESLLTLFSNWQDSLLVSANAITVLAQLTGSNPSNRRTFRKAGGLTAVTAFLKNPARLQMALRKEPCLLGAMVEGIWTVVAGNHRNEAFFFVQDGVQCLLTLLEVAPKPMIKQVLGCLADVLANPKASSLVAYWRGSEAPNALSLLLSLWETSPDQHAVLYAVVNAIGFSSFPEATPAQQSRLKELEAYKKLQQGEVFSSMQQQLQEQEGVVPVGNDAEFLDEAIANYKGLKTEMDLVKEQEVTRQQQAEKEDMEQFFGQIKDRRNQDWAAPKAPRTANTSVMRNRLAAKKMKETMLANSLDAEATMRKTAGSGARAAIALRNGEEDVYGDPEFQAKYNVQLSLQDGQTSMPYRSSQEFRPEQASS